MSELAENWVDAVRARTDELAMELFIADNSNQSREASVQDWTWFRVTGQLQGRTQHYKTMAAHVIDIGYKKVEQ